MTKDRESLLSKIRALLAKTIEAGCTEDEAMAALAKAQAMKDAFEVSEDELNLTKEEKAVLRGEPKGTEDPHLIKWQLVMAVAKFCNCEGWRRNRKHKGGGIVFCGLPSDAQLATYLLDTLTHFVQTELFKFLMTAEPDNRERRAAIREFVIGCCDRISERLYALCEQSETHAQSNARALVVIKNQAIQAKMKELDIHVSVACGPCAGDSASYRAGHAAGDRASFGRPVSGRNATLRLR